MDSHRVCVSDKDNVEIGFIYPRSGDVTRFDVLSLDRIVRVQMQSCIL